MRICNIQFLLTTLVSVKGKNNLPMFSIFMNISWSLVKDSGIGRPWTYLLSGTHWVYTYKQRNSRWRRTGGWLNNFCITNTREREEERERETHTNRSACSLLQLQLPAVWLAFSLHASTRTTTPAQVWLVPRSARGLRLLWQQLQLGCQGDPSTACPQDSLWPTHDSAPAGLPNTHSLQRSSSYAGSSLQDQERLLFHLTHRNRHRETIKMRRQRNVSQMRGQDKPPPKKRTKWDKYSIR